MKTFEAKIYNFDTTYKATLKSIERISDFTFDASINSSQGNAVIELNVPFNDSRYGIGDFIKVTGFTDNDPNGVLLYTGTIQRIERKFTSGIETVSLDAVGLTSILSFILFNQSGFIFTKNQDPALTIKNIIDNVNTYYNWFSYGANVVNYGSNINIGFDYTDSLTALKNTADTTNFWWYIRQTGEVYFKSKPVTPTHKLTAEKNVDSIFVQEDGEKIINDLYLTWSSGTNNNNDATSIADYGRRQKRETKTDILNSASANEYITNSLLENKNPKKKTRIIVNDNYNIESIYPGDTVTVRNFDYSISNLQVHKIKYSIEQMELELEDFDTLAKELFS